MSGHVLTLPTVPLVGQACTIREWFPSAIINCGCDTKHALMLSGIGAIRTCPDCGAAFAISALKSDPLTGRIGVLVGRVVPKQGQD